VHSLSRKNMGNVEDSISLFLIGVLINYQSD
jgi:hypothetical protein